MVFRQGLIRQDLQSALILPSRTETFEQLVESARPYIQSTISLSSVLSTSQRIFLANSDPVYCTFCFERTGGKIPHHVDNCNRRRSSTSEPLSHPASKKIRRSTKRRSSPVTCYRCNERGSGGRVTDLNSRQHKRGSANDTYGPPVTIKPIQRAAPTLNHASSEFAPPDSYPFFAGVLNHVLMLDNHRSSHRWIFDNGCTAHSAFLRTMFRN